YLIRAARAPNKEERVRAFPRLGPDDGFDVAQYQAMLLDAALELLVPFGYDEARLRRDVICKFKGPPCIRCARALAAGQGAQRPHIYTPRNSIPGSIQRPQPWRCFPEAQG